MLPVDAGFLDFGTRGGVGFGFEGVGRAIRTGPTH